MHIMLHLLYSPFVAMIAVLIVHRSWTSENALEFYSEVEVWQQRLRRTGWHDDQQELKYK